MLNKRVKVSDETMLVRVRVTESADKSRGSLSLYFINCMVVSIYNTVCLLKQVSVLSMPGSRALSMPGAYQRTACRSWGFSLSRGFWGSNSDCQAWQQMLLPTEPSCQLPVFIFYFRFLSMLVFCLHSICVPGACRSRKEASDPLELEL